MSKAAIELQNVGDFDTWQEAAFAAQKRIAELEALLREGVEGVSQTWDGIMPIEDMVDWVKRVDAALKPLA